MWQRHVGVGQTFKLFNDIQMYTHIKSGYLAKKKGGQTHCREI